MAVARAQPSSAFLGREFNGEVLVQELEDLQLLPARTLSELAASMSMLSQLALPQAQARLTQLAQGQSPALANLLKQYAKRVKHDADVVQLVSHFQRLAVTAALASAFGARR